jgi:hypothetical protein
MEIVFWLAVVFLLIQANINFCSGLSCTLSWIVVSLGIVMRYEELRFQAVYHS